MSTAVLVVDVQRALVEGEHAVAGAEDYLARIGSLLDRARSDGVPVLHLQDNGVEDRLIRRGTPGWELALPPARAHFLIPYQVPPRGLQLRSVT